MKTSADLCALTAPGVLQGNTRSRVEKALLGCSQIVNIWASHSAGIVAQNRGLAHTAGAPQHLRLCLDYAGTILPAIYGNCYFFRPKKQLLKATRGSRLHNAGN